MRDVIKLCIYELKIQMLSKRVLLGYLVGISIMLKFAVGYIQYGNYIGEPINVLEPFIIVGNCDRIIMLLTVGWLLIMSEAPFVNKISFYALYRTKRKLWNEAMVIYIFVQAILYYAVIAVVLMLLGGMNGYLANIWSVPFIDVLSSGSDSYLYGVDFPSSDYADVQSVYMGFFHTFALQVLYAVIIGIFVYVISQMTNRMAGPIAAFILHFLGYEIMKEGYGIVITYSLLARSIPAFQLGKNALVNLGQSYLIFIVIIILLVELSGKLVNYMDFKNMAIQEGD
ncbi:MAG: hypothetical protein IJ661_11620 [Lachnospiraceae bacterium]|nr:hypothetical protein [Lachnospiraceae bacterium]